MGLYSQNGCLSARTLGLLLAAICTFGNSQLARAADSAEGTDSNVLSTSTVDIKPAKLALLKQLCDLLAPGKNAEESLNVTFAQQEKQMSRLINALGASRIPANTSPEDVQKMKDMLVGRQMKVLKRTQELFREKIDLNSLCNTIYISIYNKHFDEKQLKDLIAFYKSPTGSHYREVQTAIVDEAMAMTNKEIQGKIIDISKQVERELMTKPESTPAAPATATEAAKDKPAEVKSETNKDKK